jgi:hypothetical protein
MTDPRRHHALRRRRVANQAPSAAAYKAAAKYWLGSVALTAHPPELLRAGNAAGALEGVLGSPFAETPAFFALAGVVCDACAGTAAELRSLILGLTTGLSASTEVVRPPGKPSGRSGRRSA